jgi:hypothetical protein
MPTPVDHLRHRATTQRFLQETQTSYSACNHLTPGGLHGFLPTTCQGLAVVMGLALQLLCCVYSVLPAWAQAGPPTSEPQLTTELPESRLHSQ